MTRRGAAAPHGGDTVGHHVTLGWYGRCRCGWIADVFRDSVEAARADVLHHTMDAERERQRARRLEHVRCDGYVEADRTDKRGRTVTRWACPVHGAHGSAHLRRA